MCKHVPFDRNSWAPCKICLEARQVKGIIKSQDNIRKQIAEDRKHAEECKSKGLMGSYESAMWDVTYNEALLTKAGLPL